MSEFTTSVRVTSNAKGEEQVALCKKASDLREAFPNANLGDGMPYFTGEYEFVGFVAIDWSDGSRKGAFLAICLVPVGSKLEQDYKTYPLKAINSQVIDYTKGTAEILRVPESGYLCGGADKIEKFVGKIVVPDYQEYIGKTSWGGLRVMQKVRFKIK